MNLIYLVVCCLLLKLCDSLIVVTKSDKKHEVGSTIEVDDRYHKPENRSEPGNKYYEKVEGLRKYTLDEKCEQGLELGIGYQVYAPYVNVGGKNWWTTYVLSGIIPHITSNLIQSCCHNNTKITFGHYFKSMYDIETHFEEDGDIDLFFPVYGLEGRSTTQFKDNPFLPIVTAPKIVLLVPERLYEELNNRTEVLMKTIFNSWPMLVFITVSAMLAGLIVWVLDKNQNSDEFPPTFFSGAWEGIWWAFVTMTTVGYGDRSPKSIYARGFCILWILIGIVLFSFFTGSVTTALSQSTTPVFNIPGSKIGAVKGSIEYQVGVELNADMIGFDSHSAMFTHLTESTELDGVLIDNFMLSANTKTLQNNRLRMEKEIEHSVTYGVAMRKNSTKIEHCFRRYIRHNPQKIFEIISKNLKPIKNPTDNVRLEVAAAEKLFYEDSVFKNIVYVETGLLAFAMLLGIAWELFVRNKDSAVYRTVVKLRRKPSFGNSSEFDMEERESTSMYENEAKTKVSVETLINEYDTFHREWIERMKELKLDIENKNHK